MKLLQGKKLNIEKSEVSFSRNIDQEKKQSLQMKLSFKAVDNHESYLGLPTCVTGSKKRVFQYIQDRVLKKIKGWKEGFLSQAGREVLIKAIIQAIPTYAMQCFKIPKSILEAIERLYRGFFWGKKKEERKIAWVAWHKLVEPKTRGGLGMRDLESFNKALLAKQAWRILKFPHSLVAKTLKNKYFPNKSFMETTISPMASFTWRSILSARDLLKRGLKKVVGNGLGVNIWEDPWVPRLPQYRIYSQGGRNEDGPQMVSDLIQNWEWNVEMLNRLFSSREVEAIRSIPISHQGRVDTWGWHFTKDGLFSTKSAYHIEILDAKNKMATSSNTQTSGVWTKIWKANTPTKVRNFGWRALHNGLAVNMNLKMRGCGCDQICPICGEEDETTLHTLVMCREARWIWKASPLRIEIPVSMSCTFWEWVEQFSKKITDDRWWDLFWMSLWNIWLRRNRWVFDGKKCDIPTVVGRIMAGLEEYKMAREEEMEHVTATKVGLNKWLPPEGNMIKLNTDAAIFPEGGVGCGGVTRNAVGEVLGATCVKVDGSFEIDVAEAYAARHAMQIAIELGMNHLTLESDNSELVNHIQKGCTENSSFGMIVADIVQLSSLCSSFSCTHVKRGGNRVAHRLAQQSRSFVEPKVWIGNFPVEIGVDVLADIE